MKKAFTIIETLVAITILMIAISGPLTFAFNGLTAAMEARNQFTASFLAQESIEYVRNIKDNNINSGRPWLQEIDMCTIDTPCAVDVRSKSITFCDPNTACVLYQGSDNRYTYSSTGAIESPFKRWVYLENVFGNYAKLVVKVTWTTGGFGENETVLKLDMYNVIK